MRNKEKIGIAANYMYTQNCEGQEKINLTILKMTFLTVQPTIYNFSIYDCSSSSSLILQSVFLLLQSCIDAYMVSQCSKTNLILCTPHCLFSRSHLGGAWILLVECPNMCYGNDLFNAPCTQLCAMALIYLDS